MSAFDTQGFVDSLKERISNPFLFTFSWLFVVWNWKAFGWFMFEPLRFSLKLERFQYTGLELYFWWPLLWTFVLVAFGHGLNNFSEMCKLSWNRLYDLALKKFNLKEFVAKEDYENLETENFELKSAIRELKNNEDKKHTEVTEQKYKVAALNKQLQELERKNSLLATEIDSLKKEAKVVYNHEIIELEQDEPEESNSLEEKSLLSALIFEDSEYEPGSTLKLKKNRESKLKVILREALSIISEQTLRIELYDSEEDKVVLSRYFDSTVFDNNNLSFKLPVEVNDYELHIDIIEPSVIDGEAISIESYAFFIDTY
ncbi:hypothetical protein [Pseudoalteromonas maricaloris]|uniref:hypothetical protein n=1 Tax=Pseudoalteromonas maricaloris TaxID=184924 RepID=UPI00029B2DB9|nr:hypothetical protein [Pseudoalteromonas flavipulchra]